MSHALVRVILTDPKRFRQAIKIAKIINRNIRDYNQARILRQYQQPINNDQLYHSFRQELSLHDTWLPNTDLYNKIIKPLNQTLIAVGR